MLEHVARAAGGGRRARGGCAGERGASAAAVAAASRALAAGRTAGPGARACLRCAVQPAADSVAQVLRARRLLHLPLLPAGAQPLRATSMYQLQWHAKPLQFAWGCRTSLDTPRILSPAQAPCCRCADVAAWPVLHMQSCHPARACPVAKATCSCAAARPRAQTPAGRAAAAPQVLRPRRSPRRRLWRMRCRHARRKTPRRCLTLPSGECCTGAFVEHARQASRSERASRDAGTACKRRRLWPPAAQPRARGSRVAALCAACACQASRAPLMPF